MNSWPTNGTRSPKALAKRRPSLLKSNEGPPRRPAVDTKVYDLAERFLSDIEGWNEEDVWRLAGVIQTACEDACREVEERGGHGPEAA